MSDVSPATGHRIRWIAVWVLIFAWFAALALNVGGNAVHTVLLAAIAILAYELLIPESTS